MSHEIHWSPKPASVREEIEEIISRPEVVQSLPEIHAAFTFEPEHDYFREVQDYFPTRVVLRKGYDQVPGVVLILMLDLLKVGMDKGIEDKGLQAVRNVTGLLPHQARIRSPADWGTLSAPEPNDYQTLDS